MSDEVFEVVTPFNDVAELGQGYINRADGERILLPLPEACQVGEGVRFIVHLADGTPAFAGAGRCVQASDQGPAAGAGRYETLLDSLAFDERSRPVYEYIVAVRQAVYAAGGPAEPAEQAQALDAEVAAEVEAVAESAPEDAAVAEAVYGEDGGDASPEEPTTFMAAGYTETVEAAGDEGAYAESAAVISAETSDDGGATLSEEVVAEVERVASVRPAEPSVRPAEPSVRPAATAPVYVEEEPAPAPNPDDFVISPVPRGMLQRASRAAHWQPVSPEPPRPSKKTGLFLYPPGGLPVPAAPPRPGIDRALVVQPAPAPTPSMRP